MSNGSNPGNTFTQIQQSLAHGKAPLMQPPSAPPPPHLQYQPMTGTALPKALQPPPKQASKDHEQATAQLAEEDTEPQPKEIVAHQQTIETCKSLIHALQHDSSDKARELRAKLKADQEAAMKAISQCKPIETQVANVREKVKRKQKVVEKADKELTKALASKQAAVAELQQAQADLAQLEQAMTQQQQQQSSEQAASSSTAQAQHNHLLQWLAQWAPKDKLAEFQQLSTASASIASSPSQPSPQPSLNMTPSSSIHASSPQSSTHSTNLPTIPLLPNLHIDTTLPIPPPPPVPPPTTTVSQVIAQQAELQHQLQRQHDNQHNQLLQSQLQQQQQDTQLLLDTLEERNAQFAQLQQQAEIWRNTATDAFQQAAALQAQQGTQQQTEQTHNQQQAQQAALIQELQAKLATFQQQAKSEAALSEAWRITAQAAHEQCQRHLGERSHAGFQPDPTIPTHATAPDTFTSLATPSQQSEPAATTDAYMNPNSQEQDEEQDIETIHEDEEMKQRPIPPMPTQACTACGQRAIISVICLCVDCHKPFCGKETCYNSDRYLCLNCMPIASPARSRSPLPRRKAKSLSPPRSTPTQEADNSPQQDRQQYQQQLQQIAPFPAVGSHNTATAPDAKQDQPATDQHGTMQPHPDEVQHPYYDKCVTLLTGKQVKYQDLPYATQTTVHYCTTCTTLQFYIDDKCMLGHPTLPAESQRIPPPANTTVRLTNYCNTCGTHTFYVGGICSQCSTGAEQSQLHDIANAGLAAQLEHQKQQADADAKAQQQLTQQVNEADNLARDEEQQTRPDQPTGATTPIPPQQTTTTHKPDRADSNSELEDLADIAERTQVPSSTTSPVSPAPADPQQLDAWIDRHTMPPALRAQLDNLESPTPTAEELEEMQQQPPRILTLSSGRPLDYDHLPPVVKNVVHLCSNCNTLQLFTKGTCATCQRPQQQVAIILNQLVTTETIQDRTTKHCEACNAKTLRVHGLCTQCSTTDEQAQMQEAVDAGLAVGIQAHQQAAAIVATANLQQDEDHFTDAQEQQSMSDNNAAIKRLTDNNTYKIDKHSRQTRRKARTTATDTECESAISQINSDASDPDTMTQPLTQQEQSTSSTTEAMRPFRSASFLGEPGSASSHQ